MNLSIPSQFDFLPRFIRLGSINIFSNLTVPLAGIISVAFLGHLPDIDPLVGVALGAVIFTCLYAILSFLRMATTGVTAQAVGRDDQQAVLLVGLRNALIALGLGILILMLQYPIRELSFDLLNGAPEVKAAGVEYFNARIWGVPAVLLNFVLIGWFLGREQSGKVLVMTLIGNATLVVQNYFYIIKWGLGSAGAGLSETVSQYIILFIGLLFFFSQIDWKLVKEVAGQVLDWSSLKSTFSLNGNIFISILSIVSTFAVFQNLSSGMGTIVFAQNALMIQLILFTFYFTEGLGFAVETLAGNFKGKAETHKLFNLVTVAMLTSLVVGLTFAFLSIFFPEYVFGILTNHAELIEDIDDYNLWLLLVLGFGSIAFMLDGYFLGLAEGTTLRNISLGSLILGFVPLAVVSDHFDSNQLLWLALAVFYATRLIMFLTQIPRTLKGDIEDGAVAPVIVAGESQPLPMMFKTDGDGGTASPVLVEEESQV